MTRPKFNVTDLLAKIESALSQDEKLVLLYQIKHHKDQEFKDFWEALERVLKNAEW